MEGRQLFVFYKVTLNRAVCFANQQRLFLVSVIVQELQLHMERDEQDRGRERPSRTVRRSVLIRSFSHVI